MLRTIRSFILIFCFFSSVLLAEERALSYDDLYRAAGKERFNVARILENGDVALITVPTKGKTANLILVNIITKETQRIKLPNGKINRIAIHQKGEKAIIAKADGGEFWQIDIKEKKAELLSKRVDGQGGFAIYGGRASRIDYTGDAVFAWGYFYDKKKTILGDYIVKINLDNKTEPVQKILSYEKFIKKSKKMIQNPKSLGAMFINKNYLTFSVMDKEGNGKLFALNIKKRKALFVAKFAKIIDVNLSPYGDKLAYIIKEKKEDQEAKLFVYDLSRKSKKELLKGILMRPVFDLKGEKLLVGKIRLLKFTKRVHQQLVSIDLKKNNEIKNLPLTKRKIYLHWQFIENGDFVVLFTGQEIYKIDLFDKKQ